jgi:pimeloyl-ACP methyl ester carboxylesterase
MMSSILEAVLLVALAVVILYAVFGLIGTTSVVGKHPEWRKMVASPSDYGLESKIVGLSSSDGTSLSAWWLPSRQKARGTVILAHGLGSNKSRMLPRASFLVGGGYNVFDLDLRTHGESGGNYMTPGYLEAQDIIAGTEYAFQANCERPIVVMGHSYGAVAALRAATQTSKVQAVISDSAFITQSDMMHRVRKETLNDKSTPFPLKFGISLVGLPLMNQSIRFFLYLRTRRWIGNDSKISALAACKHLEGKSVLFIAGENDVIAPPENTQKMYEATSSRTKEILILPGVGHSTYKLGLKPYEQKVLEFLGGITVSDGRMGQN